jgi:ABC-type Fe3+ transport system substrate-binding protein
MKFNSKAREDFSMVHLHKRRKGLVSLAIAGALFLGFSQNGWGSWQGDWEKVMTAAKKEGKVVVSIPASAELRTKMEAAFEKRFAGIDLELFPSRASRQLRRIRDELKAGVHYFDVHLGGSGSMLSGFVGGKIVDAFEPYLILPEVKDPKNWWGGHMSIDKDKRFVYTYAAFINSKMVDPGELRSYDDLLNPKWKGKMAFYDPRRPGAGRGAWEYMFRHKGNKFLQRFVAQDVQISRNRRVMAESLAKGKLALTIGVTYYSFKSFIDAGLPVKSLPIFKEGTYGTSGSGNLAIIKNHPHPNATKVFVNWLLGKEGQEIWTKTLSQPSRRLDVETKWTSEFGYFGAKDSISLEEWYKIEEISAAKQAKAKKARKSARKYLKKRTKK